MNINVFEALKAAFAFLKAHLVNLVMISLAPALLYMGYSLAADLVLFEKALAAHLAGQDYDGLYETPLYLPLVPLGIWHMVRLYRYRLLHIHPGHLPDRDELTASGWTLLYSIPFGAYLLLVMLSASVLAVIWEDGLNGSLGIIAFLGSAVITLILLYFLIGYMIALAAVAIGLRPHIRRDMIGFTKGASWRILFWMGILVSPFFIWVNYLPDSTMMEFTADAGASTYWGERIRYLGHNLAYELFSLSVFVLTSLFEAELFARIVKFRPIPGAPAAPAQADR